MRKGQRFTLNADIYLNVCIKDKACGREIWAGEEETPLEEISRVVREHEAECKPLPEREGDAAKGESSTGDKAGGPWPLRIC